MNIDESKKFLSEVLHDDWTVYIYHEMPEVLIVELVEYTQSLKPKPKAKKKAKYKYEKHHMDFATKMYVGIKEIAPHTKTPNIEVWANDIRLLNGDVPNFNDIIIVWGWVCHDDFWSHNIFSPSKFRAQFAKLHAKAGQARSQGPMDRLTSTDWADGVEKVERPELKTIAEYFVFSGDLENSVAGTESVKFQGWYDDKGWRKDWRNSADNWLAQIYS